MKKGILLFMIGLLSVSCSGQQNDTKTSEVKDSENKKSTQPKGTWKVDKAFDENGNLTRYDSIYSWSSSHNLDTLSNVEKDSVLQAFKSRFFTAFSDFENEGFDPVFSEDSLFYKHYFNDDFFGSTFGQDYMDIEKIKAQMFARQKQFLEKYQSEFIKPEDEN
ncbi:hypothetical protein [Psychroserpens sp. NJDZ02]|uniref:hypothetical protein n=1 Tax=Psychroserpens sp. NJDZ02 TaxID=2570561 RepID=UPI0010A807CF|nr:hypothetical protein [Psychroserpens sp. NJDZ02]QCE42284.1 hypothetical protein E9099_13015 [Psychroserpens sp. NJDZ02]